MHVMLTSVVAGHYGVECLELILPAGYQALNDESIASDMRRHGQVQPVEVLLHVKGDEQIGPLRGPQGLLRRGVIELY